MSKKHILIVDDEDLIRETLCGELSYLDLAVYEASDGEKAVDILQENKIDILITDIKMPQKDDFYVLDYIKERKIEHMVTFVCSGYYQDEDEKLSNYSIEAIIRKPFDLVEVLDLIREYL